LLDADRPAWKLSFVTIRNFREAGPAFQGDLACRFIKTDQAISISAFFSSWMSSGFA
jgi:hypothetical protein